MTLVDKRNERKRLEETYIQVCGVISNFELIEGK